MRSNGPVRSNGAVATLFTTGYEQHTPETLVAALRSASVRRLVDVRELPLSRRPGFSKTALAAALGDAGIDYVHARALGNPKRYRDLYRSGRVREGETGYRAHLRDDGRESLIDLAGTLEGAPTCLLCLEEDPVRCHRTIVAAVLGDLVPALRIVHLR